MKKKLTYIFLLIFFCFTLNSCFKKEIKEEKNTEKKNENILNNNKEKNMENIQTKGLENEDIVAIMKTNIGTIKIKLFTQLAPKTTTNFIGLSKKGYYNNLTFHRVIKDFMIQGGDPLGNGTGGESIYGETFEDEFNPNLQNIKYSISMANSGPNTNGSQFFINQNNNNYLDNKHSVFGQVIEGTENVDKIAKTKTGENNKPEKEIKIIGVEIKQYNNGEYKDYSFDLDKVLKEIEEKEKARKEALKNKKVEKNDFVSVHYTGKLENGEVFDSSIERGQTLDFQVGAGNIIKGFDNGVLGIKIGDKKTLTLKPEEAYGEYDENNKQVVSKEKLKPLIDAGVKIEKGEKIPTQVGEFEIIEVSKDSVTIDTNHPLAGKTLIFEIELIDIK